MNVKNPTATFRFRKKTVHEYIEKINFLMDYNTSLTRRAIHFITKMSDANQSLKVINHFYFKSFGRAVVRTI